MISVDTNLFIYTLNADERFGRQSAALFDSSEPKIASELVFTEVLSSSKLQDVALRGKTLQFLEELAIQFMPATRELLQLSAALRREHSHLKIADSIHLATALHSGVKAFVTNDQNLVKLTIPGLKIISL